MLRYTPAVAIRLLILLALVLGLALAGGPATRAQETPERQDDLLDQFVGLLSPREKVGQLLIVGFQGPEVSEEVRQLIVQQHVGGVFLNREACNIINGSEHDPAHCGFPDDRDPDTPAQIAGLTQGLQQASCEATEGSVGDVAYCLPLLISIDHEGDGRPLARLVNRFAPIPSSMAIGATFDPDQAESVGCIVGRELAAVGINTLLGPDLDVLDTPRSGGPGDQGIRVFGGNPLWAGEMGARYVQGVHQCGDGRVATVAKHFPGHGRSTRGVDYEDVPVVVGKTLEELAQEDLAPFSAVAQGDLGELGVSDAMMNSHLSYPGVEGCDIEAPVTFSLACMQAFVGMPQFDAWRGAGGLTVADDLAAGAVQAYAKRKFGVYLQPNVAEEALIAGNDLLPLIRTGQLRELQATIDHLVGRYEADAQVRERIDDAVRRVLALKDRLYPGLDSAAITSAPEYRDVANGADTAATLTSLAARSLTFIRPDSLEEFRRAIPAPTVGQRILFIECWDDPTCAPPNPTDAPNYPSLWPRGKLAALASEMFSSRVSEETMQTIGFSQLGAVLRGSADGEVRRAVEEADWLVFAFLERDPARFPDSEVLKDFLGRGPALFDLRAKNVVVFAYNSPYHLDAGELRNVDLFVAVYSKTEPSLRASLMALFHDPTFFRDAAGGGRLPVDYVFGDYVLYDISEGVQADPSQTVQLAIEPEQPVAGRGLTAALVQPLSARNGHRVPNGTRVDFTFELADGSVQEVAAFTTDGIATASFTISQPGDTLLTIVSGDLEWSPGQPIEVGGAAAEAGPASAAGDGGGEGLPVLLVLSLVGGVPVVGASLAVVLYAGWRRRSAAQSTLEQLLAVQAEVQERLRMQVSPTGTVTVLFSDIEGFTSTGQRLGDDEAQRLLREHGRILREQITQHGGHEVKSMGDGFMIAFSSSTNAVACAAGIQRSLAAYNEQHQDEPIRVRIGLNTGETIGEAGDYFGTAVTTAARIAATAEGGQILVSRLLRELVGSVGGIDFVEHGQFELKGIPGRQQVYEVLWEQPPARSATSQAEEELRLDWATHRIFVRGKEVLPPLSKEQYGLLAHLCENRGKLCTREEIVRAVWPGEEASGITEQAVDSLVHRVRERLRAAGATEQLIVTVRGQGFRLDL